VEKGVDAFLLEEDNIIAKDDFEEYMLSFDIDPTVRNELTENCLCPSSCNICVSCNPMEKSSQQKNMLVQIQKQLYILLKYY